MIRPVRTDPFIFRWAVNGAGYRWVKGLAGDTHLVPRDQIGLPSRVYEPSAGLFLEFAALKPTQEAIVEFAWKYGSLFDSYSSEDWAARENHTLTAGPSLSTWKSEIGDMQALIKLWQTIEDCRIPKLRKERLAELRETVIWTDKGVRYEIKTSKRGMHAVWLPDAWLARVPPNDVLLPARYALQSEINLRISDPDSLTIPRLAWTPDNHQRIIFTPTNLLAAMWLQFAQAVTGEFQLKRCEGCGNYFQVGPGGKRADATTCGDACRQRKNRA